MRRYKVNICSIHSSNVGEDQSHEQIPKQYCGKKLVFPAFQKKINIKRGFPFEIVGGNGFVRI